MRKLTRALFFVFWGLWGINASAQSGPGSSPFTQTTVDSATLLQTTPGGYMDTIYDQHGHAFPITDIAINDHFRTNKGSNPQPLVQCNCNSGYFQIWMESSCGMDGNSQVEIDRRNVVCQVLRDISDFLPSPLTASGQKVNIYFRNFNVLPIPPGVLGASTSFYLVPPTNYGIADNTCWTTIHSGVDAYAGVAPPLAQGSGSYQGSPFFHAIMTFNFNQPWHLDLATQPDSSQYDLYSVVLHEVCHALGISTNIYKNGSSLVGNPNPYIKHQYYSRYDLFLKTQPSSGFPLGKHLIQQDSGVCGSMYGYSWNNSLDTLFTLSPHAYSNPQFDTTDCATAIDYSGSVSVPVYTPNIYADGSSLSHLEDYCQVPSSFPTQPPFSNNLYYAMSNANGLGAAYMKRYLKPEERSILCDLGYKVNAQYGDSANLNYYSYGGTACDGIQVAGVNDGIQLTGPNAGTYNNVYTNATLMPNGDTLQNILANDYCQTPANLRFECLQPVNPAQGYVNVTSGNGSTIVRYTPTANFGTPHLLRYVPYDTITGKRGNITYVFVYVNNPNCNLSSCVTDLINNPEFTMDTCTDQLGSGTASCWSAFTGSPDVFWTNCTSFWDHTIPVPISSFGPSVVTGYNAGNSNFIGLFGRENQDSTYWIEAAQTTLASPLMPGQTYQISFWAKAEDGNYNAYGTFIKFAYSAQTLPFYNWNNNTPTYPPGMHNLPIANAYGDVPLAPTVPLYSNAATNWVPYTYTFTYPGTTPANNLIITTGVIDHLVEFWPGQSTYFFLDDIHILPAAYAANFQLGFDSICLNQTIPDLSAFVSPPSPTGVFSGAGVTYSNGVYSYNSTAAGAGFHTISYTYTDPNNCTHVLSQPLTVIGANTNFFAYANSNQLCPGATAYLYAQGATSYHWYPSGVFCNTCANTYFLNLQGTTTFTVVGTDSACTSIDTFTINVGLPSQPITQDSISYCQNVTTDSLSAILTNGGLYLHWYTVPFGGTELSSAPTPSSAVPGVYHWYVSQSIYGCESVRDTITVIIKPTPAAPTPTNPINYCQGAPTVQLTPNGTGYNWYNVANGGTPLLTAPTPSSAVGNVTTIWWVSAKANGCESGRAPDTVIINTIPPPPYVVGNIVYCINHPATTLTPNGNGVQWYNSANQPISTPTPNTAVAGTTIYHANITWSGCTGAFAYDTVVVNPMTSLSINASELSPCYNYTDTLSVSMSPNVAGTSFQWSSTTIGGSGNATISCLNPPCSQVATTMPNGSAVIFTVQAANGCSDTATLIMKNQACSACDICDAELDADYLANNGSYVNGGVYCVHNDLSISGVVTLDAAELRISPAKTITVSSGASLYITGSWLHACDAMWNGIVVENGGHLYTDYSADNDAYPLIEDAFNAVSYDGGGYGDSTTLIDIRNTTFNRNNVGVNLSNYSRQSYPFHVQNSAFTCRDLSTTGSYPWAAVVDVKAANGPIGTDLETPYLDSTVYQYANLKAPMDDESSLAGVQLNNVGQTMDSLHTNNTFPPTFPTVTTIWPKKYFSIHIGENGSNTHGLMENYNLFDRMHNGILASNTNFICKNNVIQRTVNSYVYNDDEEDYDVYTGLGIGASADESYGTFHYMEVSGLSSSNASFSNHFYDCQHAIFSGGYCDEVITQATIRSSKLSVVDPLNALPFTGNKAIQITNKRFGKVHIDHNQIYNTSLGILFTSSANGYYNGNLWVNSNCISANLLGQPVTNRYVSDAIIINHSTSTNKGTTSIDQTIQVYNNTLTNVYRGISMTAWVGKEITVQNNFVRMNTDPVTIRQRGIDWNANIAVHQDIIQGNGIYGPAKDKDKVLTGIYASTSNRYYVGCNTTSLNYNDLQFVGANVKAVVEKNKMSNATYGFVLGQTGATGKIYTQGNPTHATDNYWFGSSCTFQMATLGTAIADTSVFYIRNTTGYNPNGYTYSGNFGFPYTTAAPHHSLSIVQSPQTVTACENAPDGTECGVDMVPMPPNPPPGGFNPKVAELEAMALGTNFTSDDPDSAEHARVQQIDLIKFLNEEPNWVDSSVVLYDFYNQMSVGEAYDMTSIEDYLAQEDEMAAQDAIDYFVPEDQIGANYRTYYQLYLDWMSGEWSADDRATLNELCSGCPFKDGTVVYYARAFYTQVYGQAANFEDNCGGDGDGSTARKAGHSATSNTVARSIQVFPNPTTGIVNISLPSEGNWNIQVTDVQGRSIPVEQTNVLPTLITIQVNAASGIYMVRVTNNATGEVTVRKLTLQN